MNVIDVKLVEKELDKSYKDCVKSNWQRTDEAYYVGQKHLIELLGYTIKRSNGKHKIY